MKNLLTIDLEDWYHFLGPQAPAYPEWERCPATVEANVQRLLEIVGSRRVTFFSLGFMARRHPALVRDISARGHEIACHGDVHQPVYVQGRERFRRDVREAKARLEDVTGQPCRGYRAPGFSIRRQNLWALAELLEAGFVYDSSLLPGIHNIGGIRPFYRYPQWLELGGGRLLELPVSTRRLLGADLAFCGGGFFRFFPERFMHRQIRAVNRSGHPVVTYLHPRDIDPGQPRLRLDPYHHFLNYFGLGRAEAKFRRLVEGFSWISCADYLGDAARTGALPHTDLAVEM